MLTPRSKDPTAYWGNVVWLALWHVAPPLDLIRTCDPFNIFKKVKGKCMATVAAADEICTSTIDNPCGQCDNRTNVRILRGDVEMEKGREVTVEQMAEVLGRMTDEQFQRFIKEAGELLRQWSMPSGTIAPSDRG